MRKLLFILFLGFSFTLGYFFHKTIQVTAKPIEIQKTVSLNDQILWSLIQNFRLETNRKPYIKNQALCKIAVNRSNDHHLDNHEGLYKKYSKYPSIIQENLADDYSTELETLNGWLNSPPHRKALEKPYIYSCITTKGSYAVQIFSSCENGCP